MNISIAHFSLTPTLSLCFFFCFFFSLKHYWNPSHFFCPLPPIFYFFLSCRLSWMLWWVPFPPLWMCCWCVWSSGWSSVLWVSTCLLGSTITASMRHQRSILKLTLSTTRQNALHSWMQATQRFAGRMWRSTSIMWVQVTWHSCKCVISYLIFLYISCLNTQPWPCSVNTNLQIWTNTWTVNSFPASIFEKSCQLLLAFFDHFTKCSYPPEYFVVLICFTLASLFFYFINTWM